MKTCPICEKKTVFFYPYSTQNEKCCLGCLKDKNLSQFKFNIIAMLFPFIILGGIIFSEFYTPKPKIPTLTYQHGIATVAKENLKETAYFPNSIKYSYIGYLVELNTGIYSQRVQFTAKNAFGARVHNDLVFLIVGNGNDTVVMSVESPDEYFKYIRTTNSKVVAEYDHKGKKL